MSGYSALVAGAGYLKHVELNLSATNGITRRDLRTAEVLAQNTIDRSLKPVYDTSLWREETPGIIERIADMLSSAFILREKRRRGDIGPGEDAHLPAVLEREARALLEMVRKGTVPVIDTGGRRQARLVGSNVNKATHLARPVLSGRGAPRRGLGLAGRSAGGVRRATRPRAESGAINCAPTGVR